MHIFTKTIAAIMFTVAVIIVAGCNKSDELNNVSGSFNGHDYVDLGLPSGTLWATCNVGADSPEVFGNYFAWGETAPKEIYDWKSYLESVDDAATICWGDDWRTPTIDQWAELLENTTFTWVEENGVKGRLVKGCNGNTIFLPAAGFREECDSVCTEVGVYWSSTLHNYIPERAWSYHFTFENCHLCGTYERTRGQCVRAVLSPK